MPALDTISLKNQATTEVVFAPANINPQTNVVSWLGAGTTFDARTGVTLSVTLPKNGSTRIRIRGKVSIPIMDPVITGKKLDECLANFEFSLPKISVLADRQNLRAYIADFLTDAVVVAAVENFEAVY